MAEATALSTATYKRDWKTAFAAVRKLLANPNDTVQVFRIMGALNGAASKWGYNKLVSTPEGGHMAYQRLELCEKLMDRAWIDSFAPGTVGAAYRDFLDRTGYSAKGLAEVSNQDRRAEDVAHPYAWFGRRQRDTHDIWHVLTGYQADEPLGELCLVNFSYAQGGGLGWGFIAKMGMLKSVGKKNGAVLRRAVREGYARGRRAAWLNYEDIEKLFAEPLDAARARLKLSEPVAYKAAQQALKSAAGFMAAAPVAAE
jgi:ubiquinone biosynthesis protein COQ4